LAFLNFFLRFVVFEKKLKNPVSVPRRLGLPAREVRIAIEPREGLHPEGHFLVQSTEKSDMRPGRI
jgi:hypothetical protein